MSALTIAGHETSPTRLERGLGTFFIASLWLICGYLVLSHGAPLVFEPHQLNAWLGDDLYNGLIASGGLWRIWVASLKLLVWQIPLAFLAVVAWWVGRALAPVLGGTARYALAGAISITLMGVLHTRSLDGWPYCLSTWYSPGYTHAGFDRVEIGMSYDEVVSLIGEPLEVWNHETTPELTSHPGGFFYGFEGHELGFWSRRFIGGPYEVRSIRFKEGVAHEKFEEHYWGLW